MFELLHGYKYSKSCPLPRIGFGNYGFGDNLNIQNPKNVLEKEEFYIADVTYQKTETIDRWR